MSSIKPLYNNDNNNGFQNNRNLKLILVVIGVGILLTITILGLVIATFVKVNNESNGGNKPTTTTPVPNSLNSILAESIRIADVMSHLSELQRIATAESGTRAINTPGFNKTLDYIYNYLTNNTNFKLNKTFFSVRDFALDGNPILISWTNGIQKNYNYSSDPTKADFLHVKYSTSSNASNSFELTVIPNGGCTEADWRNATVPTTGRVALIKRGGNCAFADRAAQAPKFNVAGVLFYNDGMLSDRFSPIEVSLGQDNALPALFLSYNAGQALADAASNTSINVTVQLGINLQNLPNFPVGNICADTPTGNVTQTIVIGSHSDSVPAGPGINDNGKLQY
jgi:hypothetical protein